MINRVVQVADVFLPRHLYDLVRIAESCNTSLCIEKSGRMVSATKIVGLLSLKILPGDTVTILDFTGKNQKNINDISCIFERK